VAPRRWLDDGIFTKEWYYACPVFEVTPLENDVLHLLLASRESGVRYSVGCFRLVGFDPSQ
jgi:hypothetical protein